jgi:exonuclease SbcD
MRLIHTSDWHFGKRFLDHDMLPLQTLFCDWFVDLVRRESIDCVLVSGDVFDRANPKEDAIRLLDDFLFRIRDAGASIVLISGNHDSAERLNFGAGFMAGSGLHIRAERLEIADIGKPVIVTGKDGVEVEILPLPYLDPERVAHQVGTIRTHESVLRAVIEQKIGRLRNPARAIAMSHSWVTGGTTSDSERNLTVGGTGSVPMDLFDGFGYVALGHLHRPQELGNGRIVYSGTPMPYSFSEDHEKSVRIVSTDGLGITSKTVASTVGRPVATIEETLENILSSSQFKEHEKAFVRVRITDPNFQVGVMERVRARFPFALELVQTSLTVQGQLNAERLQQLSKRSEEEVVHEYTRETWPNGFDTFEQTFVNGAIAAAITRDRS